MGLNVIKIPNSVNIASQLNMSGPIQGRSILAVSGIDASALVKTTSIHNVSTINSSGQISAASGIFVSGLNVSAIVKGTIGEFLASVVAGSGFNASGPILGDAVSVGNIVASQVNAGSGLFQSGLDVSAVITVPSLVVTSVTVVSGAEIVTSLIALSNLQVSNGPTQLASTLEVSGIVSVGGNIHGYNLGIFLAGVETSGYFKASPTSTNRVLFGGIPTGATAAPIVISAGNTTNIFGVNPSGHVNVVRISVGGGIFGELTSVTTLNASNVTGASGIFHSGLNISGTVQLGTSTFIGSALYPMSAATVSTGAPNIGGTNASQKFGTIFAASTTIGDLAFTDERCEICESTFDIGEQVTVLLKGGVSGIDGEGNKWRYVGGPPVHMNHLVASMIRSAM